MLFVFCFLFLPFAFFSFATVLSTIISFATYFLFLSKFVNFYFGRYETKNRIRKKRQDVKNNKRQETGNKKYIVEQAL